MTSARSDLNHPIDLPTDSLRRTLDLARRALHVADAFVLAVDEPDRPAASGEDALLEAIIAPDDVPLARLVVRGEGGRSWSEDDTVILRDLAAGLAEEIRLTERIARLEASPIVAAVPELCAEAAPAASIGDPSDCTNDDAGNPAPGALRILLADDLDLNRKLICDMLSLDGYVVDSVADGAAAVDAVKAKTYDLVLMDMIMPGMDGMDATRAIRALPAPICDVPIVALTAHSFREQLDNCLHAGMNATLTKPMSFDALSTAVSTWARSRQAA